MRQTTVNIGGYQKKWKNHIICFSECSVTGGGGMQKIVGVIGKIFCQMHTFAFITCLALSKQDEMLKTRSVHGKLLFSGFDPGTCEATLAVWIQGAYSEKPSKPH